MSWLGAKMKKFGLILAAVLLAVYGAALLVKVDPDERRPGLALAGDLAPAQDTDWGFLAAGRNKIFVQMATWYQLPHSITTTSWVRDGKLFVPCGRCATKNWPNHVARDDRVRLKVDGRLFDRKAVRLTTEEELRAALAVPADEQIPEGVWVYRMDPRLAM